MNCGIESNFLSTSNYYYYLLSCARIATKLQFRLKKKKNYTRSVRLQLFAYFFEFQKIRGISKGKDETAKGDNNVLNLN